MIASHCAICGPAARSTSVYPNRVPSGRLDANSFSARRKPDRVHTEIRRCDTCGLLFATPVPDLDELTRLYAVSRVTYSEQFDNLRRTYGALLARLVHEHGAGGRLLEVGCGNGFLLDEALDRGFTSVAGVEPSLDAIADAPPRVRGHIKTGLFDAAMFAPGEFDVVCGFHVFDHLIDPKRFLADVHRVLKPNGWLLLVMHDASAWSAKLLGERSPIFDVVHPYLYDRATLTAMLRAGNWGSIDITSLKNTCSLEYWAHLSPVPAWLQPITDAVLRAGPGRLRLTLRAGNMAVMALRPAGTSGQPQGAR